MKAAGVDRDTHPFWEFSLRVYASPGVEPVCLALQERCGADVNLLLFCCWAALQEGRPMTPERLQQAMATVVEWHREAVMPLRALRRRLKQGFTAVPPELAASLHGMVAEAELDGEYVEQSLLGGLAMPADEAPTGSARRGAAEVNLRAYLELCGAAVATAEEELAILVGAAFPER